MNLQRRKEKLLFERARRGDVDGVKRLILEGFVHVNTTNRYNKQTALYVACENGHTELAKYLLDNGASVNPRVNPLFAAVRNNSYGCIKLLLEHNADARSESPVSVALQKQHYSVALLLLRNSDCDAIPSEAIRDVAVQLLTHAKVEDAETIKNLIDANIINLTSNDTFLVALDFAFQRGTAELAETILRHERYPKIKELYPEVVYYSAKNNWPTVLSKLLKKAVDINAMAEGQTPLYVSCEKGHKYIMRLLLNSGANPNIPNRRTDWKGGTALYLACKREQLDVVQMLLEAGADVSVASNQFCPLIAACKADNIELINLLVKAGADVKYRKKNDTTCLRAVVKAYSFRNTSRKSSVLDSERGLYRACNAGHEHVVRLLLETGAKTSGATGYFSLRTACEHGYTEIVDLLLKHGAKPNASVSDLSDAAVSPIPNSWRSMPGIETWPIRCAMNKGYSDIVNLLLHYGTDVNKQDVSGKSAFIHFIELMASRMCKHNQLSNSVNKRDFEILKSTLVAGGDVNVLSKSDGLSAFHIASSSGMHDVMRELIKHGADCNKLTSSGKSPLHLTCERCYKGTAKQLFPKKAEADGKTSTESDNHSDYSIFDFHARPMLPDFTTSHIACSRRTRPKHTRCGQHCSLNAVKLLLGHGADLSIRDGNGKTVLHHALEFVSCPKAAAFETETVELFDMLLTHGADPNLAWKSSEPGSRSQLPLLVACRIGHVPLVELLLKHNANVNVADVDENTALHHAIEPVELHRRIPVWSRCPILGVSSSNTKPLVDILMENKADVNVANRDGETALYRAASRGLLEVVRKMLEVYGGNPNEGSPDKSPLAAACETKNDKLVVVLLKHGADPNLTSKSRERGSRSRLPLFVAVDKGNSDIVRSLLNAGADVNAVDHQGKSIACFAAECVLRRKDDELILIRLLLQYGANFSTRMPDGLSPLQLAVTASMVEMPHPWCVLTAVGNAYRPTHYDSLLSAFSITGLQEQKPASYDRMSAIKLLQLMIKHGAVLDDASCLPASAAYQSMNSNILRRLATFDGRHEFIVDLFMAGAGFRLIAHCCNAVASVGLGVLKVPSPKSIRLCQAAILAGYSPSNEEVRELHLTSMKSNILRRLATFDGSPMKQLLNWLNEDRKQVPSLLRQCRVVIRRQLSVAANFQTILPAIGELPLPGDEVKAYLQFDGPLTEVCVRVSKQIHDGGNFD